MATVAWRELSTTVRRPTYILATLGTPLFFVVVAGITAIPSLVALHREEAEQRQVAVVDEAGLLTPAVLAEVRKLDQLSPSPGANPQGGDRPALPEGPVQELMSRVRNGARRAPGTLLRRYDSAKAAFEDLRAGKIPSYYLIPKDYMATGQLEYRSRRRQLLWDPVGGRSPVRGWLIAGVLGGKVGTAELARARQPIANVRLLALGPDGEFVPQNPVDELARVLVPFAFAFVLMLSIFIASGYLIQGLVEEKSNRVIELLLSSVTPYDLIGGKLIGLGAAGLLQLAVWVGLTMLPVLLLAHVRTTPTVALLSLVYYLVGFLFFGSIMAGVGCVAGTGHESQQFASLWSIVAVLPMFFSPLILEAPNSILSRVLSYVPFTCPITMIMRCAAGEYVWWDVPLSVGVMLASTYLALRISAKLFRVGMLMAGQRPTLAELVAALRS